MSREKENRCLEEFIAIYHSKPCLWRVKSSSYHDRGQKEAAYLKLVEKWKEIDPSCTKSTIVKKINNLRSSFRKEAKNVKASMRTGTAADEVYRPKLWYYNLLSFVEDQDVPRRSRNNMSDDDTLESEDESHNDTANTELDSPLTESQTQDSTETTSSVPARPQFRQRPTPKSRIQDDHANLIKEVLATVNNHFKTPRIADDRFDVAGKNVAMKLRDLPNDQRRLAEKFINDILFEAEGITLTPYHKLMYQPPSTNRYHAPSDYPKHPSSRLSSTSTPPQQLLLLNSVSSNEHHFQNETAFPQPESSHDMEPLTSSRHDQTATSFFSSFTHEYS